MVHLHRWTQLINGRIYGEHVKAARNAQADVIVVLGHPAFYPRFGFSAARAAKLKSPFSGEAFMVLEITPNALGDGDGNVVYPPAFG